MVRRLPSTCPSCLVFWLYCRGLCRWSRCLCYSNGCSRRGCGFSTAPGTTAPRTVCVRASDSRIVCVRDGSTISLRASVSRTERLRCGFPTATQAWVPRWYKFLGGILAKLMFLWLLMGLHVASLNNELIDVRCECARHKWQQSTLSVDDCMVA